MSSRSRNGKSDVRALLRELEAGGDPRRAEGVARFFKCGKGEYGDGDRFLGLTVPALRKLTRKYQGLPLADLQTLLDSPWHEARLAGLLLLVDAYGAERTAAGHRVLYQFYLRNLGRGRINNWDLVDASCEQVVGAYLRDRSRLPLTRLARSDDLWTRRVAIVSTYHFIKAGEWHDTFRIAEILLSDRHDLIHKATGWMLREVGKRGSQPALERFLDRYAATMPRTMLRYAIERFDAPRRADYLSRREAHPHAPKASPIIQPPSSGRGKATAPSAVHRRV